MLLHSDWSNTPEVRGYKVSLNNRYRRKSLIDHETVDTCATAGGRFVRVIELSGVQFV